MFLRRSWLLVLGLVIALGGAALYVKKASRIYEAKGSVYISAKQMELASHSFARVVDCESRSDVFIIGRCRFTGNLRERVRIHPKSYNRSGPCQNEPHGKG